MIKNRIIALIYRLVVLVMLSIGLTRQLGVFHGSFWYDLFKYYTIQSNLLAIIMFTILLPCTINGLKENLRGSAAYLTRFRMVCSVNLLLTFFVFWILLAPNVPMFYLFTFDNILIHIVAPLSCLFDYILFSETGKLKYKDVYLTCIYPYIYSAAVIIMGYIGYNYGNRFIITEYIGNEHVRGYTVPIRAPYFFLDFDEIGLYVLLYSAGLLVFILLMGHVFYFLDRRLHRKNVHTNNKIEISKPMSVRVYKYRSMLTVIMIPAFLVTLSFVYGDRVAEMINKASRGMWLKNETLLEFEVEIREERIIFLLDDSEADITDYCSATEYFEYEYFTENSFRQVIVVGGTLDNLGWVVFIWDSNGNFNSKNQAFLYASPNDTVDDFFSKYESEEWHIIAESRFVD